MEGDDLTRDKSMNAKMGFQMPGIPLVWRSSGSCILLKAEAAMAVVRYSFSCFLKASDDSASRTSFGSEFQSGHRRMGRNLDRVEVRTLGI